MFRRNETYLYARLAEAERDRARLLEVLASAEEVTRERGSEIGAAFARGALAALSQPSSPISQPTEEVAYQTTPQVSLSLLVRRFFGMSKRKKRLLIAAFALMAVAMVSSIAAAIIIYTGSNGSVTGGKIESAGTNAALTVSARGTIPDLVRGSATLVPVTVQNNSTASVTPLTWTITYSTPSQPACASHLATGAQLSKNPIAASASINDQFGVTVAAALPDSCASVSWVGTVTGTTNP